MNNYRLKYYIFLDELNEKMTDAIKQAVEQLAPGIISKIYGPPRDKAKT